jgi:hypothetical protein
VTGGRSAERINLAEVRAEAIKEDVWYGFRHADVLALVEAVEAAHALRAMMQHPVTTAAVPSRETIVFDFRPQQAANKGLDDALARFDFGGAA